MSEKMVFTDDDLNSLQMDEKISIQQEVQNLAILAKNELSTIEKDALEYQDNEAKRIKDELNALLIKIVSLRKSTENE